MASGSGWNLWVWLAGGEQMLQLAVMGVQLAVMGVVSRR